MMRARVLRLTILLALSPIAVIAAACRGDDDSGDAGGGAEPPEGVRMSSYVINLTSSAL